LDRVFISDTKDPNPMVIRDRITAYPSHINFSAEDTNHPTYTAGARYDDTALWVNNTPVNVCVTVYGPYQQAQANDTSNDNVHNNNPVSPKTPIKTSQCTGSANGGAFTGKGQARNFDFLVGDWTPGFYYFVETVQKGPSPHNPAVTDPYQPGDTSDLLIGNYISPFNTKNQAHPQPGKDETAVEKFQLKATSYTTTVSNLRHSVGLPGDNNQNGAIDDNEKDTSHATTILTPDDQVMTDTINLKAYDTDSAADTDNFTPNPYWLKDLSGKYLTFYTCVNLYGPYQQPQSRDPTTQIGSTTQPTIPVNSLNSRDPVRNLCFWTDGTGVTSSTGGASLVDFPNKQDGAGTTTTGGPGNYVIDFNNQGEWYLEPGYYYSIWSVETGANSKNIYNTVAIGSETQIPNGEFLENSWWSPFGEPSESFVSQFQPIARSAMAGRASTNTHTSGNNGAIFECEENVLKNMPSILQGTENLKALPKEKLTCKNVTDRVYLGATDYKDIRANPDEIVTDDNIGNPSNPNGSLPNPVTGGQSNPNHNNDQDWLKDATGQYESVKFQVKLYGPFTNMDVASPDVPSATDNKKVPAESNQAGKTIQIVPFDPNDWQGQYFGYEPIAKSCVISSDYLGPNWNDLLHGSKTNQATTFNPTNDPNYDPIAAEKTSVDGRGYYRAILSHSDRNSYEPAGCEGNQETPSNTTLELQPGIYISVVEILKSPSMETDYPNNPL
jgi:hypothetical protein